MASSKLVLADIWMASFCVEVLAGTASSRRSDWIFLIVCHKLQYETLDPAGFRIKILC